MRGLLRTNAQLTLWLGVIVFALLCLPALISITRYDGNGVFFSIPGDWFYALFILPILLFVLIRQVLKRFDRLER